MSKTICTILELGASVSFYILSSIDWESIYPGVRNYLCKLLRKGPWAIDSNHMLFHGSDNFTNDKLNAKTD